MARSAEEILLQLLAQEGNNLCFDCGNSGVCSFSTKYGVWLCYSCSVRHIKHDQRVCYLSDGRWEADDIASIEVGGNKSVKQFLESQADWDATLLFDKRYKTKAAEDVKSKIADNAKLRIESLRVELERRSNQVAELGGITMPLVTLISQTVTPSNISYLGSVVQNKACEFADSLNDKVKETLAQGTIQQKVSDISSKAFTGLNQFSSALGSFFADIVTDKDEEEKEEGKRDDLIPETKQPTSTSGDLSKLDESKTQSKKAKEEKITPEKSSSEEFWDPIKDKPIDS